MGKIEKMFQEWFRYIVVLVIGLIILYWTLNLIHTRAPGVFGSVAGKVGVLSTGSSYNF